MNADTDGDGQNDLVDEKPVFAENPVSADGTMAPFEIGEALVVNNYDPVAKADGFAPVSVEIAKDAGGAEETD